MMTLYPSVLSGGLSRVRWRVVWLWCALTAAVAAGLYLSADGGPQRVALVAMGLTLWLMTVGVAVAAGWREGWTAACASGSMVDTSGFSLWICGALSGTGVGFVEAAGAWCLWGGMWLIAVSVVRCRGVRRRVLAAVVLCGVWVVLSASLLWAGGWLESAGAAKVNFVTAVSAANPVNGALMAVVEKTAVVWQNTDVMYAWSQLGDTVNPRWVSPFVVAGWYALAGLVILGLRWVGARCCAGAARSEKNPGGVE